MEFKHALGATVDIVGHFTGGVIVQRGTWESLSRPEPVNYYVVRLGDKELTVSEAEIL
jgi:hypothetical protein